MARLTDARLVAAVTELLSHSLAPRRRRDASFACARGSCVRQTARLFPAVIRATLVRHVGQHVANNRVFIKHRHRADSYDGRFAFTSSGGIGIEGVKMNFHEAGRIKKIRRSLFVAFTRVSLTRSFPTDVTI